jgi:hypothetical protein
LLLRRYIDSRSVFGNVLEWWQVGGIPPIAQSTLNRDVTAFSSVARWEKLNVTIYDNRNGRGTFCQACFKNDLDTVTLLKLKKKLKYSVLYIVIFCTLLYSADQKYVNKGSS